ncbi:hypothetical protein MNBD_GAMMA22-150 [hydrothermal vent metagenome]|uniref:Cytochrome b561 bacterial/Ni-hydrogenase domain-containing protein n=1 Tax=hydrothermal vent metagenome TaxID=652676 RepID=A0A3B1A7U9_9ZZZZ
MSFILINNNAFNVKLRTKISECNINSAIFLTLGFTLLLLYLLQLISGYRLEFLYELQQNNYYKQITGYLLLLYVLYQFRLAKVRNNTEQLRYYCSLHKMQGVAAPLVLYVHSMELGYAYQVLLSCLFLFNCFVGLVSPQQLKIRNALYVNSWLILHVSIAILIVGLVLYHLFITYWYS